MKWTREFNSEKPHRCPECHGVAERAREPRYGPRTVFSCGRCLIKWRARVHRSGFPASRSYRQWPWFGVSKMAWQDRRRRSRRVTAR